MRKPARRARPKRGRADRRGRGKPARGDHGGPAAPRLPDRSRAVDGSDALRHWETLRGEIDLLFTDMVMPGELSGRDLADRLRAAKPKLKVIISTGYSQEANLPGNGTRGHGRIAQTL